MSLLTRYIFRQAFGAFLLTLATLTAVVWLTQALRQLDLLTAKGQSLGIFVLLTVLVLPMFLSVIAPIALFIAALYTLYKLNSDSELVVISAAGASRRRIILPFVYLAMLVSLMVATINLEVMPRSLSLARYYITQVSADLLANIVQEGRFTSKEANLTFHIRERSKNGELLGLLVHDSRDPKEIYTYLADRGRLVDTDQGTFLIMDDGSIQRQSDGEASKTQIVAFQRYVFDLSQFQNASEKLYFEPRERPTSYLLDPDPADPVFQLKPGRFRSELHDRLASPLYPFMFVFIALAAAGFARTTRQNRGWAILIAVAVALGARLGGFALLNLARADAAAIPLVYGVPLAVIAVGAAISFGLVRGTRLAPAAQLVQSWSDRAWTAAAHVMRSVQRRLGGETA